jgi:hypothetical protein
MDGSPLIVYMHKHAHAGSQRNLSSLIITGWTRFAADFWLTLRRQMERFADQLLTAARIRSNVGRVESEVLSWES